MGGIASAAGVVRRTVYGHFPSRLDLVRALTERAVAEMTAVLSDVSGSGVAADAAWAGFIARLWPVAHRYRVLLALRRGEYGEAAYGAVFAIADSDRTNGTLGARAATITSLLMLGVPQPRAIALAGR
jgi:AcrR family transcriptional regulator